MSRYRKSIRQKEWENRQKDWNTKKFPDTKPTDGSTKPTIDVTTNDDAAMNLSLDCLNIALMNI